MWNGNISMEIAQKLSELGREGYQRNDVRETGEYRKKKEKKRKTPCSITDSVLLGWDSNQGPNRSNLLL